MSTEAPKPLVPTRVADRTTYAVAGGNHVTLLLDRSHPASAFDVIEVLAQPGGGPPPHRHAFADWFRMLDGELTLAEERDGTVVCTSRLAPGDTIFVPPWAGHGARRVRISIRTPPHIVPRNIGPLPIQALTIAIWRLPLRLTDPMIALTQRLLIGDLSRYGLASPREGAFTRHTRQPDYIPLLDVGFVRELKRGRIQVVAAVEEVDGPRVQLADGSVIEPEAVIAATGYERGLEPLVGHLGDDSWWANGIARFGSDRPGSERSCCR